MRHLSLMDKIVHEVDSVLQTLAPSAVTKSYPGSELPEPPLTIKQQQHIAGLMRVNHTGEVCAQALYQGQALGARSPEMKIQMKTSALEEKAHLAWCAARLEALHASPSRLNPLWYGLSFILGAMAGCISDSVSLGFVAETERQVTKHLAGHLANLAQIDPKTQAILTQMHQDEQQHAELAIQMGAYELPLVIKKAMRLMAKTMTSISYYG